MTLPRTAMILVAISLVAVGCGGGGDSGDAKATPEQRVERCLEKQPDATRADCEQWEEEGQLADDGTHQGHTGG